VKKSIIAGALAATMTLVSAGAALATPSTQVWIPSTDVQAYKTLHLNLDNYLRTSKTDGYTANVVSIGPTVGILPWEKLQGEIGADFISDGSSAPGQSNNADSYPVYFHFKLGTPEDSLFKNSPAIAAGMYNMGIKSGVTNQNIAYGLLAKTLPLVGRLSAGGYSGNAAVLRKPDANKPNGSASDNNGVLLSWDRTISEVSDKLWVAVDYMSGKNLNGALSFGASWAFSKNVSVILGYDIYNEPLTGGKNTVTTQVDINFP